MGSQEGKNIPGMVDAKALTPERASGFEELKEDRCCGLDLCPSANLYVKVLTPSVMVFGDGTFERSLG